MTRTKVLTVAVALGLLWAWTAMVAASIGELEFTGFPSEIGVTGEEVQLVGGLRFNEKEHEYAANIRLWVSGHDGRIEPNLIAGPMYDGETVPITVYLEGIPGTATLHADDIRCPRGTWTIELTQATPTSTPTSTSTPTNTPTPMNTPTPTSTASNTPTPTPTPYRIYLPLILENYGTPVPTATPTATATPTPTSTPVVMCYCCSPGNSIYRIDASLFSGYTTTSAADSPLTRVTSPPAPLEWNQPDFAPDSSWRTSSEVWSPFWADPPWGPLPGACKAIGLQDENDDQEALNGTTHLHRHIFTLSPPEAGMQVTGVVLEMWSDNKTEWWWQGTSVSHNKQGPPDPLDLFPAHVQPYGGTYVLAIQNSNDYMCADDYSNCNPHGTACRLCVSWTPTGSGPPVYLPPILKVLP